MGVLLCRRKWLGIFFCFLCRIISSVFLKAGCKGWVSLGQYILMWDFIVVNSNLCWPYLNISYRRWDNCQRTFSTNKFTKSYKKCKSHQLNMSFWIINFITVTFPWIKYNVHLIRLERFSTSLAISDRHMHPIVLLVFANDFFRFVISNQRGWCFFPNFLSVILWFYEFFFTCDWISKYV